MNQLLDGQRILVTGGSRGLGRAICLELVRQGARVAFTYHRDDAAADATLAACSGLGAAVTAHKLSVLDYPATKQLVRDLDAEWGGIDALINNAGITQPLPFALLHEDDWDQVMDVNVKGVFLTTRAALKPMIRAKAGVILNIGSLAGERMLEVPVHYAASKAALRGFTEALARAMSRHGIRVLCLAPGLLEAGVGHNIPKHKRVDYLEHCALGRVGRLEEAAAMAAFLVSSKNTYMNGSTTILDGGV